MDTRIVIGATVFTVMAALVQMELETRRERITDSVTERSAAGNDLGRRRPAVTDFQTRNALRLIEAGGADHPGGPRPGDVAGHPYRRIRELRATVT